MIKVKKVILVDGNNLLFRSYFATAYTGNTMRNSKGFPTNGLYGLVNMLNKIIREEKPEYMLVAFDKGMEAMMAMKKEYKKRRDFLVSRINEMDKISCIMPKGAFYVFANIKKTGLSAEEFAERLLEKEHVAVIPGSNFSKNASGYVRISYGTSMEKIEDGLKRMERFLKSL